METASESTTRPVQNGDRMNRDEFKARCEATPPKYRAELLDGAVYMAATRWTGHGSEHASLVGWLGIYEAHTPGVFSGGATSVDLGEIDMPEPDAILFIDPECGGLVQVTNGYVLGPPELVSEIAGTTVDRDMGPKRNLYHRFGVREYLVWRTEEQVIDWFVWRPGQYTPLAPASSGVIRSQTFPGLWLDVPALLAGNLLGVHAVLHQGLATPEHAAFVALLAAQRGA